MTVKDLRIGDVCYGVYNDGYTVLFNVIDIGVNIANYAEYVIKLNQYNNEQKYKVCSHVNNSYIIAEFNGNQIAIFFTKTDALEELDRIIENCNDGKNLIQ